MIFDLFLVKRLPDYYNIILLTYCYRCRANTQSVITLSDTKNKKKNVFPRTCADDNKHG